MLMTLVKTTRMKRMMQKIIMVVLVMIPKMAMLIMRRQK